MPTHATIGLALAVGLVACRPTPHGAPTIAVSSPSSHASPPTATAPPAAAIAQPPPPWSLPLAPAEVPMRTTELPSPFRHPGIVVAPVVALGPVVLFSDEAAQLRRDVARALARRGLSIVPMAEVERIETAALAGTLASEGDTVCAAPLSWPEIQHRAYRSHVLARIEAMCFEHCVVQVVFEDAADGRARGSGQMLTSARVRRPEDPESWRAAVKALKPTTTVSGGLVGGLGISSADMHFGLPSGIGPWSAEPPALAFVVLEAAMDSCAHPDPFVGVVYDVTAAIDDSGSVTRCEAATESWLGRNRGRGCVCDAMQSLQMPAGRSGRRLRVDVTDRDDASLPPAPRIATGELRMLQTGTEDWRARWNDAAVLRRCLGTQPPAADLDATIGVDLDPSGNATSVRIVGDIVAPETIEFADCLAREIEATPLPCRPPGIEQLRARAVIDVH